MPNTSTMMIKAATTALPSWNAPLLDLCLLLCLRPMAWPFRRTPLALHCSECSSRGASPIPLASCPVASIHRVAEKGSARKPAVPKVATQRILTQQREYLVLNSGTGAGRRGACSGLSIPCMSMHNPTVVVQRHRKSRGC